jgi:hypothetical protein
MAEDTNITADASNTTGGATGNSAQGANAGGATDASQTSQEGGTQTQAQAAEAGHADPEVARALALLETKGLLGKDILTKRQHDGHLAQVRRSVETEMQRKNEDARRQTEEQARVANGEAAKVAEERAARITTLEADMQAKDEALARLSKHVNAQIDAAIQNVPAVLREFDPGAENLAGRMDWYEKLLKHPEVVQGGGDTRGTGLLPAPRSSSGNPAQQYAQNKYKGPITVGSGK